MTTVENDTQIKGLLRDLFNSAAAMSMAVINQDDAEPEMARFLHAVKSRPEMRSYVVQLFIDSFSDQFHMIHEPWRFMQFCMHDLKWPELKEFIESKRNEDIQKRGSRSSTVWNEILESFDNVWSGAKQYQEFRQPSH